MLTILDNQYKNNNMPVQSFFNNNRVFAYTNSKYCKNDTISFTAGSQLISNDRKLELIKSFTKNVASLYNTNRLNQEGIEKMLNETLPALEIPVYKTNDKSHIGYDDLFGLNTLKLNFFTNDKTEFAGELLNQIVGILQKNTVENIEFEKKGLRLGIDFQHTNKCYYNTLRAFIKDRENIDSAIEASVRGLDEKQSNYLLRSIAVCANVSAERLSAEVELFKQIPDKKNLKSKRSCHIAMFNEFETYIKSNIDPSVDETDWFTDHLKWITDIFKRYYNKDI